MIRANRYLKQVSDLEKLDVFEIALKLLGYYIEVRMNTVWKSFSISFAKDVSDIGSVLTNNVVIINTIGGEVSDVYVKIRNEKGQLLKFNYEKGQFENLGDVLDEVLIYI